MLSWKEYTRTTGGLSRYLTWFKDFRRPKDIHSMSKPKDRVAKVSLFGEKFDATQRLMDSDFEQGSLGDNYLLTMCAALASRGNIISNIFH
jgi:hypothetical protein